MVRAYGYVRPTSGLAGATSGKHKNKLHGNRGNYPVRLDDEKAKQLLRDWLSGEHMQKELAEKYGVSKSYVSDLVLGVNRGRLLIEVQKEMSKFNKWV